MDNWPMWVKIPAAALIMCVFWGIMLLPTWWPALAFVPLAIVGVAVGRSWKFHSRK